MVPHGGRQMCLAETDAAVNKERVIFLTRAVGYCLRGGVRELVTRPDHEFGKREALIELRMDCAPFALAWAGDCRDGDLCNSFRWVTVTFAGVVPVRDFAANLVFAKDQLDFDRVPDLGR